MVRIFFPGQDVPEWLFKREPHAEPYSRGTFKFCNVVAVYTRNGRYNVSIVVGGGDSLGSCAIQANGMENMVISGQSPYNDGVGVHIYTKPWVTWTQLALFGLGLMVFGVLT